MALRFVKPGGTGNGTTWGAAWGSLETAFANLANGMTIVVRAIGTNDLIPSLSPTAQLKNTAYKNVTLISEVRAEYCADRSSQYFIDDLANWDRDSGFINGRPYLYMHGVPVSGTGNQGAIYVLGDASHDVSHFVMDGFKAWYDNERAFKPHNNSNADADRYKTERHQIRYCDFGYSAKSSVQTHHNDQMWIVHSDFHNSGQSSSAHEFYLETSNDCVVEYCVFHDSGANSLTGLHCNASVGESGEGMSDVTIRQSTFYNIRGPAFDTMTVYGGTIDSNKVWNCQTSSSSGYLVRIVGAHHDVTGEAWGAEEIVLRNNTIIATLGSRRCVVFGLADEIEDGHPTQNCVALNNICISPVASPITDLGVNNTWAGLNYEALYTAGELAAFVSVDPTSPDFLRLKPATVFVDAGVASATNSVLGRVEAPTTDFDGNPRPVPNPGGVVDIGAYELYSAPGEAQYWDYFVLRPEDPASSDWTLNNCSNEKEALQQDPDDLVAAKSIRAIGDGKTILVDMENWDDDAHIQWPTDRGFTKVSLRILATCSVPNSNNVGLRISIPEHPTSAVLRQLPASTSPAVKSMEFPLYVGSPTSLWFYHQRMQDLQVSIQTVAPGYPAAQFDVWGLKIKFHKRHSQPKGATGRRVVDEPVEE